MPPKSKKKDPKKEPKKASALKKAGSKESHKDDANDLVRVDWAVPKAKGKSVPDERHVADYAQTLYQIDPNELKLSQAALPDAHIRSPIFQKAGKDMQPNDANRSSTALRDLFNDIKRLSVAEPDGRHDLAALRAHFEAGDENTAVVLSKAENDDVLVLAADRRLEVTMNNQNAHIDFIRRAPSGKEKKGLGYFIQVRHGTLVTVNSVTYTNNEESSSTPFFIGPLEGYAVIELLSQPVFFFRNEDSLKHMVTTKKVAQDELDRRDPNGDVGQENVRVRWRQLGSETPAEEAGPQDKGGKPEVEKSQGKEKTQGKEKPAEEKPVDEDEFSDAFTDDGKPIKNPQVYLQSCLKLHMRERLDSLIPRVIASINYRQPENTGFSFLHDSLIYRPGRTLITGVTQADTRILLIAEIQPDKKIRIRILDPMTWRTTKSRRKTTFTVLQRWLLSTDWWENTFESKEQIRKHMPKSFEWVPCAQSTTHDGTFTYTVLNAWALAMGLELNPEFRPNSHDNEVFFIKAQQLFDMALRSQLTWKLVFAFLSSTGFVKPVTGIEGGDDEDAKLPAKNQRFDQRKCSFKKLIDDQDAADERSPDKKMEIRHMPLRFEEGMLHKEAFPSDGLTDGERDEIAPFVREGQWSFHDTTEQLKQRLEQRQQQDDTEPDTTSTSTLVAPQPSPPIHPPPPGPPQLDHAFSIPEDFNPCGHLRAETRRLSDANKTTGTKQGDSIDVPRLSKEEIQNSIAAVARAVNLLHPPGAGITTEIGDAYVESSTDDGGDLLAIYAYEAKEYHDLCILLQNPTGAAPFYTVVDSAPWATSKSDRAEIRDTLNAQVKITEPVSWVFAPEQARVHHCGHHVVLNAWSVILGLPLNLRDFASSLEFISAAHHVIQAVIRGDADWLLIWALLRCHNYVGSAEAPEPGRRFARTVPSSEHAAYKTEMNAKTPGYVKGITINTYSHFQGTAIKRHDEDFHWDDFGENDRKIGIPEVQHHGLYHSTLPRSEMRTRYAEVKGKFKPCKYLRENLDNMLADKAILSELKQFRLSEDVVTEKGKWLDDSEAALAINSVLMAINDIQDFESGFSIVGQNFIQACSFSKNPVLTEYDFPAVRPGRPLIALIWHEKHFVLSVAQLNDENLPTISILNSRSHHYKKEEREKVFEIVWRVLRSSSWWRGFFPDEDAFDQVRPDSAAWVKTAQQPGTSECGYYVILNAWSLALGLELNPNVKLQWTLPFFQELLDLVHLARLGYADSRLIFSFLRCHDIVRDGFVPDNRRFPRTQQMRTVGIMDTELEDRYVLEQAHWMDQSYGPEDLTRMRSCNRIPGMNGIHHNGPKAVPSDKWTKATRKIYVPRLEHYGILNKNLDDNQMKDEYDKAMRNRVQHLRKRLAGLSSPSSQPTREELVDAVRTDIGIVYQGREEEFYGLPGPWVKDTIRFFDDVRKDDQLRKIFGQIGFSGDNKWKRTLENDDLNFAVVSVLEAIDNLQSDLHTKTGSELPFAGGFSLTTSANLQMALSPFFGDESSGLFEGMALSRPRRAWLIPLVVSGEELLSALRQWATQNKKMYKSPTGGAGGHSILALVQEVPDAKNKGKTHFEIHILDSSIKIFRNVGGFIRERIEQAAHRLGWSTHRNGLGETQFDGQLHLRTTLSQQPSGGWQCGHHVLINAWILALGLNPNDEAKFDSDIYRELYSLAQAATSGILDWRTLAGWLIRHELVIEDELQMVPERRRFNFTSGQTSEVALDDMITNIYMPIDQILGTATLAEVPYDHTNNISDFSGGKESGGLKRYVEDADLEFLNRPQGTKRKRWEISSSGLDFLDSYSPGFKDEWRGMVSGSSGRKRRRASSHMSFLDVYLYFLLPE